jgi:hypothetical protein
MLPFSIMNHYGNVVVRDDYKRFVDELTNDSTNKLVTYTQSYSQLNGTTYNRIYMYGTNSVSGTMWGTPYGSRMTWDSSFSRVIQHCFPTQSLYNDFIASTNNSRVVCLVRSDITTGESYISLARNGYTSSTYGRFSGTTIDQFIYYDESTARVMIYNPGTMSTPVFYYN